MLVVIRRKTEEPRQRQLVEAPRSKYLNLQSTITMNSNQLADFRERFIYVEDLGRWMDREEAEQHHAECEMIRSMGIACARLHTGIRNGLLLSVLAATIVAAILSAGGAL